MYFILLYITTSRHCGVVTHHAMNICPLSCRLHPMHSPSFTIHLISKIFFMVSRSNYSSTTCTLTNIHPLSNPIILHSLHVTELNENSYQSCRLSLCHTPQLYYPCIRDFIHPPNTSKLLRLSISTTLVLDAAFHITHDHTSE